MTEAQVAEVAAVQARLEATARKEESGAWERLAPYIAALPHAIQRACIPKPGAEAAAKVSPPAPSTAPLHVHRSSSA